jgi:hypothetical protein
MGKLDAKKYIAYFKADGNSMGALFNACETEARMKKLSRGLQDVIEQSFNQLEQYLEPHYNAQIPPVKLILAGDDCFAIFPAAYALDLARQFCLMFESKMEELLREPDLRAIHTAGGKPTMTGVVVICKSDYPYTLAHSRCDQLLKRAKRFAKQVFTRDARASTLDFQVIVGNTIDRDDPVSRARTMRPYWVSETTLPPELTQVAMPIQVLLDQRYALARANVPSRRIAQLRDLFDVTETEIHSPMWANHWETTWRRIKRSDNQTQVLKDAWHALAGAEIEPPRMRTLARHGEMSSRHGLPDLIEMWDYTFDLSRNARDYERGNV